MKTKILTEEDLVSYGDGGMRSGGELKMGDFFTGYEVGEAVNNVRTRIDATRERVKQLYGHEKAFMQPMLDLLNGFDLDLDESFQCFKRGWDDETK